MRGRLDGGVKTQVERRVVVVVVMEKKKKARTSGEVWIEIHASLELMSRLGEGVLMELWIGSGPEAATC